MPKYLDSKYDLAANTYTAKEQSFAVCEVGDAKQPDVFYPQIKIMRWDNEVNFSARLVTDDLLVSPVPVARAGVAGRDTPPDPSPISVPAVSLVDDKIQWVTDQVEAHFYEVGEGKEGGGYEFEIILKELPKSNVISMTLQTKGLDFCYQPPLAIEEIKEGCNRPEIVVGSYAVYHQTMAGDHTALGGKNYLAGKAFHIFRPRIEDAESNWVWGDLNIDEKAGLLTVTIPQDFLDKAVYPIRHAAGLEFGYHTVGLGTAYLTSVYLYASGKDTPAVSGIVSAINLYGDRTGNSKIKAGIYTDSSGPTNKVGTEAETANPIFGGGIGWAALTVSISVVGGNYYWLCFVGDTDSSITLHYDDPGSGNNRYIDKSLANYAAAWPATHNKDTAGTKKYSVYATYTATGNLLIHPGMNGGLNWPSLNGGLNG